MTSQLEVENRLAAYYPAIKDIIFGAWSDWLSSPHQGVWSCNRSRAVFVWEQMIIRAKKKFADDPRVEILRKNESYVFLVDGLFLFRFKKSDVQGYTRNYPTQSALDFHDPQEELPGLPKVSRFDLGYVLNNLQTAVEDILLVARVRDSVRWTVSVLERLEGSNVVTLAPAQAVAPPATSKPLVRVKSAASEKKLPENSQ